MKMNEAGYVTQGQVFRELVNVCGREEAQSRILKSMVPRLPTAEELQAMSSRERANFTNRKIVQTMTLSEVVEFQLAVLAPEPRHLPRN